MKTFLSARGTAALALLLCCLANSARSAELSKPASSVEVNFSDPDSFTDARISNNDGGYRDSVFSAVRSFVATQAGPMLPAGYSLGVTITDMDLGHRFARRATAPGAPSFEFTYQVTDASGSVVRHGTENLKYYTDFSNFRLSVATTDIGTELIQAEKPMLKDWAVSALSGLKQK